MKFDQALARVGATIVKTKNEGGQTTLYLRIDTKKQAVWNEVMTEFLLASADTDNQGKKRVDWDTDISKYFFPVPDQQVVKFLWRVILIGNPRSAAEALGRASQRAMASGVEVTSMPLVGRKTYEHDPANGKIAGAYGTNQGARIIAGQVQR